MRWSRNHQVTRVKAQSSAETTFFTAFLRLTNASYLAKLYRAWVFLLRLICRFYASRDASNILSKALNNQPFVSLEIRITFYLPSTYKVADVQEFSYIQLRLYLLTIWKDFRCLVEIDVIHSKNTWQPNLCRLHLKI